MDQLFVNWQQIKEAIDDVRSDSTATNWMSCSYVEGAIKELQLVGTGEGGIDEMKQTFQDNNASYAFARIEEMIDNSLTIKFAFVKFVGQKMKPMLRAGITPQVGEITTRFKPYHVDMYITSVDEISQQIVEDLVGQASMSRTKVLDSRKGEEIQRENEEKQKKLDTQNRLTSTQSSNNNVTVNTTPKRVVSSTPKTVSSPTVSSSGGGSVEWDDLEAIQEAIREVRHDGSDINWMAITYAPNSKTKLTLLGKGTGGVEEMKQDFQTDKVYFGLVRTTEIIDESETVKFVFIHMLGDKVGPMLKARVSIHKGTVEELLRPYHTTLFATEPSEITENEVKVLVAKASQSYNWEIKKYQFFKTA
ncbi:hypothetical protein ABK040_005302 [Willaertia magna]